MTTVRRLGEESFDAEVVERAAAQVEDDGVHHVGEQRPKAERRLDVGPRRDRAVANSYDSFRPRIGL